MIKTLIFDLGGVIVNINRDEAVRRFYELGVKDISSRLNDYAQTGVFGDFERGALSGEQFRLKMCKMTGREITTEQCSHAWRGFIAEIPQRNLELLDSLRERHYRLILLSNTNEFIMAWAESEAFDGRGRALHTYFDAEYKSFEQKMLKPDPGFFSLVIQKEGINPQEAIFLDDGLKNVQSAASVGLHTFQPVNGEDWRQRFEDLLHSLNQN
ncbi:MAG: HAD family phosphatase [Succinivibrio sp.]|nr:HAD family phosphatase [Succinivibrio sp.]